MNGGTTDIDRIMQEVSALYSAADTRAHRLAVLSTVAFLPHNMVIFSPVLEKTISFSANALLSFAIPVHSHVGKASS